MLLATKFDFVNLANLIIILELSKAFERNKYKCAVLYAWAVVLNLF